MYESEFQRTLWVGNLSQEVDEELLFELFLQAGPLDKVSIPKGSNGYSMGYGFVTFKQECSVLYAIALMQGVVLFGKRILPQLRFSTDQIPKHKKRASLQDNRRFPYQSPQSPHQGLWDGAFQGYHIPVVGASRGPAVGYKVAQQWSAMIPSVPHYGGSFAPLWPQHMIPEFNENHFQRRRTHHGFQPNTHIRFDMESPWHSTPYRNIVCCDNSANEDENVKEHANNLMTSHNIQDRPCRTMYDRRRLSKK